MKILFLLLMALSLERAHARDEIHRAEVLYAREFSGELLKNWGKENFFNLRLKSGMGLFGLFSDVNTVAKNDSLTDDQKESQIDDLLNAEKGRSFHQVTSYSVAAPLPYFESNLFQWLPGVKLGVNKLTSLSLTDTPAVNTYLFSQTNFSLYSWIKYNEDLKLYIETTYRTEKDNNKPNASFYILNRKQLYTSEDLPDSGRTFVSFTVGLEEKRRYFSYRLLVDRISLMNMSEETTSLTKNPLVHGELFKDLDWNNFSFIFRLGSTYFKKSSLLDNIYLISDFKHKNFEKYSARLSQYFETTKFEVLRESEKFNLTLAYEFPFAAFKGSKDHSLIQFTFSVPMP